MSKDVLQFSHVQKLTQYHVTITTITCGLFIAKYTMDVLFVGCVQNVILSPPTTLAIADQTIIIILAPGQNRFTYPPSEKLRKGFDTKTLITLSNNIQIDWACSIERKRLKLCSALQKKKRYIFLQLRNNNLWLKHYNEEHKTCCSFNLNADIASSEHFL